MRMAVGQRVSVLSITTTHEHAFVSPPRGSLGAPRPSVTAKRRELDRPAGYRGNSRPPTAAELSCVTLSRPKSRMPPIGVRRATEGASTPPPIRGTPGPVPIHPNRSGRTKAGQRVSEWNAFVKCWRPSARASCCQRQQVFKSHDP